MSTSADSAPARAADDPAESCIRDMMGLVALPALWAGRDGPAILQIMSEALGRVVAFDFCFIDVVLQAGEPEFLLAKVRSGSPQGVPTAAWQAAARHWSSARIADGKVFEADTPLGAGRVLGLSMGFGTHGGKIWFGAKAAAFPSHHQLALLRVATSLAATGLQAARVNHEREQASRAKDEFLAMLAHELRNPLAPISAAAQLLTLAEPDRERVRKASAVIARQARHMTGLVDDLLDVSRVTRGLIVLEEGVVELAAVVAEAVEQARPLVEARHHHLAVHLADEPLVLNGDHKRLVQVVSNLLNNAAKYTHEGGNIVLRLESHQHSAVISVSDDGVGMAPDLVKRAFELFAQAQRSADRSQGGLGLGLALVKSLVELHRGSVTAHSAGPGHGSSFTVRLPRRIDAPAALAPSAMTPARGREGRCVMIVDDNADAAHMLGKLLETLGHTVHIEHDAESALAAVSRVAPEVFLLDIGLPEIDGYELARRLRAWPGAAQATLVAITGYGGAQDRERATAAGFDHHFVKPVDLDALIGVVDRLPPRRSAA